MENSSDQSFWQFSDQLRLQSSSFANLSLNDSIWSHTRNKNSNSFTSKRPEERRNFDIRVGAERTFSSSSSSSNDGIKQKGGFSEINNRFYENGWNMGSGFGSLIGEGEAQKNVNFNVDVNGGFNKGIYSKLYDNSGYKKSNNNGEQVGKLGKKNSKNKEANNNDNSSNISNNSGNRGRNSSADKRFKTLPPSESLPRGEAVGGYIFVCNNDTMQENLKRQLFGLPPRYRDSVRAIRPGLPLFLYNYSTHQLHGIFEASSFGGTNIDPTAWEDKKCLGESRFPAQVRVVTRQICEPMEEDSFRPVLHHYDGPKFRLELNIPEALALLDIFAQKYNEKVH